MRRLRRSPPRDSGSATEATQLQHPFRPCSRTRKTPADVTWSSPDDLHLLPHGTADTCGWQCRYIEQAAAGHRFLFHSHPDLGPTTYAAWSAFIRRPHVGVRAEYSYDLTPEQMDNVMTEARDNQGWPLRPREAALKGHAGYHRDGPHAFLNANFF
ncbi:hypothetical protein [Kitasatospora sp. NPDC001683]